MYNTGSLQDEHLVVTLWGRHELGSSWSESPPKLLSGEKMLVAKPDELSLVPGSHTMEGEDRHY